MAADQSNVPKSVGSQFHTSLSSSGDTYSLQRDYTASARLNLQHFLMKETLGYLLPPAIPIKPDMKIADIATGTGIWAIDLSRKLPATVSFECYDISASQFPPDSILPANVKFGTFDASAEIPEDLVAKFDVVRVALVVAVVRNGDPSMWIHNLTRMLKPGGHLVWQEGNFVHTTALAKEQPVDGSRYPKIATRQAEYLAITEKTWDYIKWVPELGRHFEKCGLQEVKVHDPQADRILWRAFTENFTMLYAEMVMKTGSAAALAELPSQAQEISDGAIWPGLDPMVVVGRKAA